MTHFNKKTYDDIFEREAAISYPVIDDVENTYGYSLDERRLLDAARILACPIKTNPPNWQHGRLIYSALRKYCEKPTTSGISIHVLDIGTAKGFSALCMKWALMDAGIKHITRSVDVIDPDSYVYRNTVAEVQALKSLHEILAPWPEAKQIDFYKSTGIDFLRSNKLHIHFAFIDGKHRGNVVMEELGLLKSFQKPGDIVIADDVHLSDVDQAVRSYEGKGYDLSLRVELLPNRAYQVMVRS